MEGALELVQVFVQAGEDVEHALVGQASFRVQRSNVFAVNLTEEGERVGISAVFVGHLDGGIFHVGGEIGISANPGVFSFIGTIQEETHRCAIEYQRSLQRGGTSYSELDRIRGVGLKRKQALLKAFGSLKAIAAADREKLEEVVDKRTAEAVFGHFHRENDEKVGEKDS